MGFLGPSDVKECDALYRQGTVKVINAGSRTLDVQIGDVTYEDVDIHYHCRDSWKGHTHPHTGTELDQMLNAFSVDDVVLVLCDANALPLYVVGFVEDPQSCGDMIVLVDLNANDYWHWLLGEEVGVHENPNVALPSTPVHVTTYWTCEGVDVLEKYRVNTPAGVLVDSGECSDVCGFAEFSEGDCCGAGAAIGDESLSWRACPCGGDPDDECKEYMPCTEGKWLDGYGTQETEEFQYGGCPSTQDRSGSQEKDCDDGKAWDVTVDVFSTQMNIDRRIETGAEEKDICTVMDTVCGPYLVRRECCDGTNCSAVFDPYNCGGAMSRDYYLCLTNPRCSRWIEEKPGGWGHRDTTEYEAGGGQHGGCVTCDCRETDSAYREETGDLSLEITMGEVETTFPGSYSFYFLTEDSSEFRTQRYGYSSEEGSFVCHTCDTGVISTAIEDFAQLIYNEVSYGVSGFSMVAMGEDNFAVLLPKLTLAVSGQEIDGEAETVYSAVTEMMLRIAGDSEYMFNLASKAADAITTGLPSLREYIGVKPSCVEKEYLPYEATLRGFHYLDGTLFVAFSFGGDFYAYLIEQSGTGWQKTRLSSFESFVEQNDLEGYGMFLAL